MRIFLTGDTHIPIDLEKLAQNHFKEQKELTKEDYVIVLGDFGLYWHDNDAFKMWQSWLQKCPFTTLWLDGNHENFEALYEYPQTVFAGACCHKLRPHVLHVMRGEVLQLAGHKILCMGGADSHDKIYRTAHISWWREERPSLEEFEHARRNLMEQKPDIIVSHDAPARIVLEMYPKDHPGVVPEYLEQLCTTAEENHIKVTDWYFGHHHIDDDLELEGIRYHMRYQKITEVLRNIEEE